MKIKTLNQGTKLQIVTELNQKIVQYLNDTYFFRKFDVEQWLGLDQILFIRKTEQLTKYLT